MTNVSYRIICVLFAGYTGLNWTALNWAELRAMTDLVVCIGSAASEYLIAFVDSVDLFGMFEIRYAHLAALVYLPDLIELTGLHASAKTKPSILLVFYFGALVSVACLVSLACPISLVCRVSWSWVLYFHLFLD